MVIEQLIKRHGLYVATDLGHTYQHLPNCHKIWQKHY